VVRAPACCLCRTVQHRIPIPIWFLTLSLSLPVQLSARSGPSSSSDIGHKNQTPTNRSRFPIIAGNTPSNPDPNPNLIIAGNT